MHIFRLKHEFVKTFTTKVSMDYFVEHFCFHIQLENKAKISVATGLKLSESIYGFEVSILLI